MAKQKPTFTITTYGIYDQWHENAKALPKITQYTTEVIAQQDVEFGFTVNVKKAKGLKLTYIICHPFLEDEEGNVMPPFEGVVYVDNNNWNFYLGDCIWLPLDNKQGRWHMMLKSGGKVVVEKIFNVVLAEDVVNKWI